MVAAIGEPPAIPLRIKSPLYRAENPLLQPSRRTLNPLPTGNSSAIGLSSDRRSIQPESSHPRMAPRAHLRHSLSPASPIGSRRRGRRFIPPGIYRRIDDGMPSIMAKQFAHYARRFSTCTSSITIRMPRFSHQFSSAGSQAQKLRQLGVKPSKSLSPALVDGARMRATNCRSYWRRMPRGRRRRTRMGVN